MRTLLLDTAAWDLVADAAGNVAVAADPYALAQDAASAVKVFQGEIYYDTAQGVPYYQQILGRFPPVSLMKAKFVAAAKTVPGVAAAACFISSVSGRTVRGQVQVTDRQGRTSVAGF